MRWRSWAWSRFAGRSTANSRGGGEPGSQPRRSLGMTAALAAVLCGQGLFTLWGTVQTTQATVTQQHDIDRVSRAYHDEAQQLVAGLRRVQTRILATTGLGFALGLALVAMIWRAMLGYQRRVLDHAATNQHLALHDPLTELANRALF